VNHVQRVKQQIRRERCVSHAPLAVNITQISKDALDVKNMDLIMHLILLRICASHADLNSSQILITQVASIVHPVKKQMRRERRVKRVRLDRHSMIGLGVAIGATSCPCTNNKILNTQTNTCECPSGHSWDTAQSKCVAPRFPGFEIVYENNDANRLLIEPTQQLLKNDDTPSTSLGGNWIDYITDTQMRDFCIENTSCKYIVVNKITRRIDAYTNLKPTDIGLTKLTEGLALTVFKILPIYPRRTPVLNSAPESILGYSTIYRNDSETNFITSPTTTGLQEIWYDPNDNKVEYFSTYDQIPELANHFAAYNYIMINKNAIIGFGVLTPNYIVNISNWTGNKRIYIYKKN